MEPLCDGDIIRYNPLFDIGNTGKEKIGTVVKVDKRKRLIIISNMDILDRMRALRRIGCYNPTDGSIGQQNGVRRYVKEFKLREDNNQDKTNELVKNMHVKLRKKVRRSLSNIKEIFDKIDPSMGDFITNKYNKK